MGAPLYGGNSSVGRAPDCDSGCRGFEPRFSPHFLLGFQPNTQLKDISYRVFIKAGSKRITKTFNSKRAAVQFANGIESDRNKLLAYTQSKSHTLLSVVIDKYLSSEYKGTRVNDERRKLSFWLEALSR